MLLADEPEIGSGKPAADFLPFYWGHGIKGGIKGGIKRVV
jgi:hypothetical protein